MMGCNTTDYARIQARVEHFENLEHEKGVTPRDFDMIIVDEAHRFRNAWEKQSQRMLHWMAQIRMCPMVVYMSGTPIVHDEVVEIHALHEMMGTTDLHSRLSYYDPRTDTKRAHHYAKVDDQVIECPMTWAQCFRYMLNRRQTFSLHIEGEEAPRTRTSSSRNTYNTLLRSICNCPFPETPAASSKMMRMIEEIGQNEAADQKQVVYSSRKDTGVCALLDLWRSTTRFPKSIFRIDGTMSKADRADQIVRFNRCTRGGVLFITDAGAQGIDLKRVNVMHIMEPADNIQEERQIVNRAVRFKAHREKSATVRVCRYVSTFPTSGSVQPPWKRVIHESGLFDANEMHGITRRVQYALLRLIREEEHGRTIDERTIEMRAKRDERIQACLKDLQECSVEHVAKKRADDDDGVDQITITT